MSKTLISTQKAWIRIYQAINGKPKHLFNPLETLKGLGNEQLIIMKIYGFKRIGLINYKPDLARCQLTELGFSKAVRAYAKDLISRKNWDGTWHFLIFDVPEEYRKYRDKLRRTLLELGCHKVQLSIWISPVDILEELKLLLPSFKIGDWVQVIKSKEVSNEQELRRVFGF